MSSIPLRCALSVLIAIGASVAHARDDRQKVVNIYAWAEYFPSTIVHQFEKETGIHVNYTVFDSPETAETSLSAGHSNYDIVTMNAVPHLEREIPQQFWKKLDASQIPNSRNADPLILKLLERVDPGNTHAVPWMWGTTGVIYNAEKVKSLVGALPAESLDLVFKKEYLAKFQRCGVSILDNWRDILPMVARYLGQAKLSMEPAQLDRVVAKLREIRPYLQRITSSGYYEQLSGGELCLAIGYSGDAMIARRMAKEGDTHVQIDYAFPGKAVPVYVDSLVIPADSPNAIGAHRFINFVMRPEISAEVTRYIGFASGNSAAIRLLEPAVRNNTIIYPPPAVRARFYTGQTYSTVEMRTFTRVWQRFSTGQ